MPWQLHLIGSEHCTKSVVHSQHVLGPLRMEYLTFQRCTALAEASSHATVLASTADLCTCISFTKLFLAECTALLCLQKLYSQEHQQVQSYMRRR